MSLQICPGYRKPMNKVEKVNAITNLGLEGDAHAIRDSSRQVLLIESETLDELKLSAGEVKENITTSGINLMRLRYGDRLNIGAVVLEVTKACSPCSRMEDLRPGLKREIAGRRGMLARVIDGGVLQRGEPIVLTERPR
ncbi:MAG TPA: MOSC domain-containing protein [Bacteroidota bacterium]|nr:MOSC domain-containing protein [Bacteroidota bacterium]